MSKASVRLEVLSPRAPQEIVKFERNWGKTTPSLKCFFEQADLDKIYRPYAINMSSKIQIFVSFGDKKQPSKHRTDSTGT